MHDEVSSRFFIAEFSNLNKLAHRCSQSFCISTSILFYPFIHFLRLPTLEHVHFPPERKALRPVQKNRFEYQLVNC